MEQHILGISETSEPCFVFAVDYFVPPEHFFEQHKDYHGRQHVLFCGEIIVLSSKTGFRCQKLNVLATTIKTLENMKRVGIPRKYQNMKVSTIFQFLENTNLYLEKMMTHA